MSKFAKKLNIPNCRKSTGNCVHYLCTACLDLQKNSKSKTTEIQFEIVYNTCMECLDLRKNCKSKTVKIRQKIMYIIFEQNVWICRKFDCLELRKLNGKLCTLHVRNVWI